MFVFDWLKRWFAKPEETKHVPVAQGGGTSVTLERVLQRLDPNKSLPWAVRAQAIKTLGQMSGRVIHSAAKTGNVKQARSISDTLQRVEQDFPTVFERMNQEEKSLILHQKDRAAARVARLEGNLRGADGNASNYGAKPDPRTAERRKKLRG